MPLYPRPLPGLRDARIKAHLTQQALASRAGMSVSAVARIEQGSNEARAITAVRLAYVLGVPVETLTGGVAAPLGVVVPTPDEDEDDGSLPSSPRRPRRPRPRVVPPDPGRAALAERNAAIVARRTAGESLAAIAADLGISRERVRQIALAGVAEEKAS